MNKAKIIFKVLAIVSIPLTGYLAVKGHEKYQDEMCMLRATKPEADISLRDKTVVAIKSYGLAAGTGALGIGSVIAIERIGAKELMVVSGGLVGAKKRLDSEIRKGQAYRKATLDTVGEEKESEIRQVAAKNYIETTYINGVESDETLHTFRLNWFEGKPIEFRATMAGVINGLTELQRELFDYNSGSGYGTLSCLLANIGGEAASYISEETDQAGWNTAILAAECDCYWLPFEISKCKYSPDTYEITTYWYPNYNIFQYTEEQEKEGVI